MRAREFLSEVAIDNKDGLGAVPNNQEIDYFGLRVKMKPSTFLKLSLPLPEDEKYDYVKDQIKQGKAIGAPFLQIGIPKEWDDKDFSKAAKVVGHEGRHRMKAVLELEGNEPIETHLFPKGYRNRDMTSEFVSNLNRELISQSGIAIKGPFF